LAKQLFPLDLELTLPYRAPHEFRNNRTLILIAKGLVKCRFNVIGNTKINGGQGRLSPLLKLSTIKLYPSLEYGQSQFQRCRPDGKIQAVLREIEGFQEITSAGDY
jgi:hypothetical protein